MKKYFLPSLILMAAVWFLYFQTGSFEFLRLDDHDYTFRCAFVREGLSWANIREAFSNARHAAIWMPVTYITYMADISLFGPGMGPHHLVNVAIHSLNAMLFYWLLVALSGLGEAATTKAAATEAATTKNQASVRSARSADPTTLRAPGRDRTPCGPQTVLPVVLAAAFWALHPQRVEAVAWIAGRKELLCAFFTLLGLLVWVQARGVYRLVGGFVCCALACMSKPTGMCFPFLAFAVDLLAEREPSPRNLLADTPSVIASEARQSHRIRIEASMSENDRRGFLPALCAALRMRLPRRARAARNDGVGGTVRYHTTFWLCYTPLLLMAIATGALAIYSQTHPEGRPELALFSASLSWRLLNAMVAIGLYLFQAIVPVGIHLDYRSTPGDCPLSAGLGLSTLALAIGLLVFLWHKRRRLLYCPCLTGSADTGALSSYRQPLGQGQYSRGRLGTVPLLIFFLAALAPTLGIFGSFGEHARADRFFYLPSMALSMALVGTALRAVRAHTPGGRLGEPTLPRFVRLVASGRRWGLSLLGGLGVLVVLCASFPVVASYKNDFTAFSRTLQFDPDNGRALAHVASEECARFGHIDKGITLYRRSQELRPRDDTAAQLAYTLALRGLSSDYAEIRRLCAKFACDHSLDRKGMALEALGTTAMRQRKWNEAISCLTDSIKAPARFYSAEDAQLRLGACLCNAKRPEEAIRIFEPLTQSKRTDISTRARQFLGMLKKNPRTILFF